MILPSFLGKPSQGSGPSADVCASDITVRDGICVSVAGNSGDFMASDCSEVDVLREFYISRLTEVANKEPNSCNVCDRCSSALDSTPSSAKASDQDVNNAVADCTVSAGYGGRLPVIDREALSNMAALNVQLEEYYRIVNEEGNGINGLNTDDPLSRIYLSCSSTWPRPSELLGINDAEGDIAEALEALDRRDMLCRKILEVQHCYLMALIGTGGQSVREVANLSPSFVPRLKGSDVSKSGTIPSRSIGETSSDLQSDGEEVRRLRRMVELYKNELSRLYDC
ncbi:uncharacterized protein BXIN_0330 [Babesia sp. Xinjiang]|uniref:uncharacterized protein n=1 Tax=Babesia sp. Xinjiang TaxID=462227 RepID=UPI000A24D154|nr:uncharacterized protein BXIN_0277 [Babesia sp. Xinjiang]XP_028871583.1 uncharacterized protein BXIN_0330 [Babesia sp. Xinjiang]ORM41096.1 hypothetical protein BXIN_0277 [Babesia sp. Xinjiang]ORM41127.1 hypothetical protein BXIN_0330 [Babesia sp. Xinjiang]